VKAEHPNAKHMNSLRFGPNSDIFPFKDLDFDGFVEKYVKTPSNLRGHNSIKRMIVKGKYKIENLNQFHDRIQVIDGGKLGNSKVTSLT
jgi:hypothetical protein